MSPRGRWVVLTVVLAALIVGVVVPSQGGRAMQQASPAASTPCPTTTEDENETLVRRYIEEAWNQGNVAVLDEVMAPTIVMDRPGPGADFTRDSLKARISELRAAFPDLTRSIFTVVTEDEWVVVRADYAGTHQGDLSGAAPSGRPVVFSGMEMMHITCGQISEAWMEADSLGLRRQVGIITEEELASVGPPVATPAP
jgi:steroid delta-isomerase-like uncharacterized protein